MRRIACLLSLLAACSSSPPETKSPPTPAQAETPTTPEPLACADGEYATLDGACQAYPKLAVTRASAQIAPVRDHHTTAVVNLADGPYLYVVGGTDARSVLHTDVQRAKIGNGGALGAFEVVGKLPEPRAGHCIVQLKDRLLLVGGVVNAEGKQTISASTVYLSLGADGKIASATPGPDLPQGVMHDTCDLAGDFVYVMGGRGEKGVSTDLSARARVGADGTIGAWEAQTPLTPKRSHHASFVRGKRLYLVGGLDGNPVGDSAKQLTDVVFADLAGDGTLGAWTPAGRLPVSVEVSSATLYKDAVYLVGGVEDNLAFSAAIRRATFNADGTVTKFTDLPAKLPAARGHVHETPMNEAIFFSVGGQNDDGDSLGTVDVGTFTGG